ncbi:MAG: hypothetical protein Q7S92_02770, partial [Candidatus Diapherotrites archaeon]|nr:hypothetical protein [Candidatus Diapherotrites archaeon]
TTGYQHVPGIAAQLRQLGITPIIVHSHPRKKEGTKSRAWKAYLKRKTENKQKRLEREHAKTRTRSRVK